MIPRLPIHKIMSRHLNAVPSKTTVQGAVKEMSQKDVGSLLIQQGDHFIGIITENDIVKKVMANQMDPETTLVDDIMSFPIYTIDKNELLDVANEKMGELHIRHLLVTDQEKPVGVLSVRNLLDAVYDWSTRLRIT